MKTYKKIVLPLIVIIIYCNPIHAQVINWKNEHPAKRIFNLNVGGDYGVVAGIGNAHKITIKKIPVWLNLGASTPAGKNFLDDYKIKTGGQIRLLDRNKFQLSAGLQFIYRMVNTQYVKAQNFGNELSVAGGYYTAKWFIAAELGYDDAAATYIKHKESYKEVYPDVKDGWYEVPTGGNFNYGIQTGIVFGRNDVYLKTGMLKSRNLKSAPLLPFYAQLGYNIKF